MPLATDPTWQLPWLRLHLLMRDLLAGVRRELARCAELRRAMDPSGGFN